MAFIKRVTGPRWAVVAWEADVEDKTVLLVDPAIDPEKSDIRGYLESLFEDDSKLAFRENEKPTRFRIRPMTPAQKDFAAGMRGRQLATWRIRCGVLDVENRGYVNDDGVEEDNLPPPKLKKSEVQGRPILPKKWVDELDLPEVYMLALGAMIDHLSEAQRPLSSNSGPPPGPGGKSDEESDE